MDLLQREHHKISAETGMDRFAFKSAFKHNFFCFVKFVWLANIKPKRIASALHGFLASSTAFLFLHCYNQPFLTSSGILAASFV